MYFLLVLLVIIVIIAVKSIKVVRQSEVYIIERLGRFHKVADAGLTIIIPFFDHVRSVVSLKQQTMDVPPQNVITKDNVSISINALLYFQIVDPKSAVYEIQNLPEAIEKLTQTNLRNLVGQLDLDESLVSRDKINHELRAILDDATNKWGVKVNRVELQDIIPPTDIQSAMEKQMKAERDRRAAILEAEGLKKSAVLKAEGEKEAAINRAEGEKKANILRAEGVAQARILEADGEKEAIQRIINALADKGQPDKYLIAMKYLETMQAITSGQDNKVVYMPYEATGILSSVDGIKQMFDANK